MTDATGRILVLRHGETAWSRARRHTGRTDVPLTPEGEAAARAVGERLVDWRGAVVIASPLQRARRTAELAGFEPELDPDLQEWDYGSFEGRTSAEIQHDGGDPDWTIWTAGEGLGESLDSVQARAARVLDRCRPHLATGRDVVLVAHAHLLRVLAVTWMTLPPLAAEHLVLDPAGTGILGYDRGTPVLQRWNS
jgi:broad specificity phosphatase PhoE